MVELPSNFQRGQPLFTDSCSSFNEGTYKSSQAVLIRVIRERRISRERSSNHKAFLQKNQSKYLAEIKYFDRRLIIYKMYPKNFKELIHDRARPTNADFMKWTFQLLKGLLEMHSHCVVHGDLTPAAIQIDNNRDVVISHYGISHALYSSHHSLRYLPPENRGRDSHGIPSIKGDVYSLGVILYELLHFERPGEPLYFNRTVSQEMQDFIQRCLQPKESRPQVFELFETNLICTYTSYLLNIPCRLEDIPEDSASIRQSIRGNRESIVIYKMSGSSEESKIQQSMDECEMVLSACYAFDIPNLCESVRSVYHEHISSLVARANLSVSSKLRRQAEELSKEVAESRSQSKWISKDGAKKLLQAISRDQKQPAPQLQADTVDKLRRIALMTDNRLENLAASLLSRS